MKYHKNGLLRHLSSTRLRLLHLHILQTIPIKYIIYLIIHQYQLFRTLLLHLRYHHNLQHDAPERIDYCSSALVILIVDRDQVRIMVLPVSVDDDLFENIVEVFVYFLGGLVDVIH